MKKRRFQKTNQEFLSHKKKKFSQKSLINPGVVYGKNPIREILKTNSRQIHTLFTTSEGLRSLEKDSLFQLSKQKRIPIEQVDVKVLNKKAGDAVHQNLVANVEPYSYADIDVIFSGPERQLVLALDSVTDPQNLATLCRSALAFGVHAILLPKDRSVEVTAAVCKASSGAVEHLKIVQVTNLARALTELKDHEFWIYGTSLTEQTQNLTKIEPAAKSVVVLGSEGKGLRDLVAKSCDVLMKIPMVNDFDSLNVAQAGTVCLYDFAKKMSIFS